MPRKTGILKHIAEIISQNKSLTSENEKLNRQNEFLSQEIEKYKVLLNKLGKNEISTKPGTEKKSHVMRFKTATVLYADVIGFEQITSQQDPKLYVDSLDEIFIKLQQVVTKFPVRSIRTIGDSLMLVGGIPQKNITNPIEVLLAAIEMQYFFRDLQRTNAFSNIWKLRIGIHTGTVIADVSGKKRPHYEVKGETVNHAARIRQFCEEGQILISATTYELVKDLFNCEYYKKMPVKYEGEITLYSVKSIKTDYSLQGKGIIPNKKFSLRFGLIQFTDLQEYLLDKLEKELPPSLFYHNIKHTVDVVTQVELIGIGEGVTDEELLLLKTAALFHDAGHTISYDNHEYFSCLVAREMLTEYYYTTAQIDLICELIMATKLPPRPANKLEKIMCDADLDYLGRSDMIPVSNLLFMELKERSKIKSLKDWNSMQVKFISGHQYFTETARNLREVNKQLQIERIRNLIVEE
ncbi:MAG TPA: adenylate/guanylate cyclase domain-containing protein [Bacteroidales bacterium]|nr:adenylate/guanylate cyclase domain-containing protein [Bacteroidales bacterium]